MMTRFKLCSKCNDVKELAEFNKDRTHKDGRSSLCRDCHSIYNHSYYAQNKEKALKQAKLWHSTHIESGREANRKQRHKIKLDVLSYYSYGSPLCSCCGEKHIEFLSIDHINGGGNKHRVELGSSYAGGAKFYRWLKKEGYPIGYRVLCHNCNQSLGSYGYCPHQETK